MNTIGSLPPGVSQSPEPLPSQLLVAQALSPEFPARAVPFSTSFLLSFGGTEQRGTLVSSASYSRIHPSLPSMGHVSEGRGTLLGDGAGGRTTHAHEAHVRLGDSEHMDDPLLSAATVVPVRPCLSSMMADAD